MLRQFVDSSLVTRKETEAQGGELIEVSGRDGVGEGVGLCFPRQQALELVLISKGYPNYHKLGGLGQQEFLLSQCRKLEACNQGARRAPPL